VTYYDPYLDYKKVTVPEMSKLSDSQIESVRELIRISSSRTIGARYRARPLTEIGYFIDQARTRKRDPWQGTVAVRDRAKDVTTHFQIERRNSSKLNKSVQKAPGRLPFV
jgi:hypothetical protein